MANVTLYGVNTTFPPGASVQTLYLTSSGNSNPAYSTATTKGTGNITQDVTVNPGNTLKLCADLNLSDTLMLAGTLDAHGHAVSAVAMDIGFSFGPATLFNAGPVTTGSWLQGNATQVKLTAPGNTLGILFVTGNSLLTIADVPGQTSGLTLSDPSFLDQFIDPTSNLILEVNGLASGWVLRWADPVGGDHIADLQSFINAGEISFSYLNGGSYTLTDDSSYTYVNVIPAPEPSSLVLLGAVGLASLARLVRRESR